MCYYSSISVNFKIIEDRFGAKFVQSESFQPVYSASAFVFPKLPVIRDDQPDHISLMFWGLIPFWSKDAESASAIRKNTLNARAETIFEKPAFRSPILSKRCLIIADGFFEWRHVKGRSYPYYIRLINHDPFAFAGIWDSWNNTASGEVTRTFSVITTEANSLLEKIHNTKKRMPVILPRNQERDWLDNRLEQGSIRSRLRPYDSSEMEAYPVSRSVLKFGLNTNHPEVTEQYTYPELSES